MGYDLRWQHVRGNSRKDGELHLTVWEMSQIRDRMLRLGAAYFEPMGSDVPRGMLTGRSSSGRPGIPAYKVGGTDGWLVRPDEITEALRIIAANGDAPKDALWKRWLRYVELAVFHGGFRVR